MSIEQIAAVQVSNSVIEITWRDEVPDDPGGYSIYPDLNASGLGSPLATFNLATEQVHANVTPYAFVTGDVLFYRVGYSNNPPILLPQSDALTVRDLDQPFTYGPVDALADTIRYTSLAEVKTRLGIADTNTDKDDLITQSAIAAEVQIDQINARSFPDTGANPEWPGVPSPIASWATDAAIAVYKRADAPFGTAGSDNWIGTLDTADEVERALRRNPLALGYRIAWGIG